MLKLYNKSELCFSLILIGVYVLLFSVSDAFSEAFGFPKSITSLVGVIYSALIYLFARKNSLLSKLGLCRVKDNKITFTDVIFFIFIISANLWYGVALNANAVDTVFYVVSMICVGFIEEVVFRGFLFNSLRKDGIRIAVLISSLSFGMGHIVNLFSGEDTFMTLFQICYAAAIGFAFTSFFYKKGSILPCITVHCVFNSLSIFSVQPGFTGKVISSVLLTAVPLIYGILLIRKSDKILDN